MHTPTAGIDLLDGIVCWVDSCPTETATTAAPPSTSAVQPRHAKYDVDEIKRAAAGRWPEILSALTGIPTDVLDGKHHPCPKCGGTDRFNAMKDFRETGGVRCNQCFPKKNSDGIAAVMHYAGVDFPAALRMNAEYLGVHSANGKPHAKKKRQTAATSEPKKAADEATLTKDVVSGDYDFIIEPSILEKYATAKPPITPAGIKQCGGKYVTWPASKPNHWCIRLDGHNPIDNPAVTAVVLLRADGLPFPATDKLDEHKTHSTGGSINSWLASGDVATAETILDVEGVPDLFAAVSAGLPPGWVAVTNSQGCTCRGTLPRPWAKGKRVVVSGDADEPGQEGLRACRRAYKKAGASEVLDVIFPYPIAKNHGKDLRDWLNDGNAIINLPMAEAAEFLPLTDTGLAERFAAMHGGNVRYCYAWKKWLAYDGQRWNPDCMGGIEQAAKLTVRCIYNESERADDDEKRKAIASFGIRSEAAKARAAMIQLARSEPGIPVLPEVLDIDPMLLNCTSGTLDLRTGELRPHNSADMLTKLCPVRYDPAATCNTWYVFLEQIFAENYDLIDFIQRLCGYFLTGSVEEQILPILYGSGSNGKSTFINVLLKLLGPDYAMKSSDGFLMMKKYEGHPTEKTDLCGKRLVACVETADGGQLSEVLIKELTGGDPIRARRMREDNWQFDPTHKPVLATNHKPVVVGTDWAIWRRLRLIPFAVKIPDDKQDKQLGTKLLRELPGIFAWAVRGCIDWRKNGLQEPPEVMLATKEYEQDEDVLGKFIEECCVTGYLERERTTDLYKAFLRWGGSKKFSQKRFGTALSQRTDADGKPMFERSVSNGTWYGGISLLPSEKPKKQPTATESDTAESDSE